MTRYRALALQTPCRAVNGLAPADARARIGDSVERLGRQIAASKAFIGDDLRLVVLPEYALTSYPMGESIPDWIEQACLAPDGPEYAEFARIARAQSVYLAVNAYETDPDFPGLYFQACVVFSDAGEVVLRYRRMISMFAPTPHDVWSEWRARHGHQATFPVADTPIGRLGCIASEEILYPEVARALALSGAEVLLHSTSEVGSPGATPKDVCKRARAVENLAYVVSANSAGIVDHPFPNQSTDGMSKVVDYEGRVLAEAGFGESMVAHAEIDLEALRAWRRRPGMANTLARQRLEPFREVYARSIHAPDMLVGPDGVRVPERDAFRRAHRDALARLDELGIVPGGDDD